VHGLGFKGEVLGVRGQRLRCGVCKSLELKVQDLG